MSKKLSVLELPIYKEYFEIFKEVLEVLESLLSSNSQHIILLTQTYKTTIQIFPQLNAGYNYWGTKGKLQIYNKVRILISQLQSQLYILNHLDIIKHDYFEPLENSIRYVGALIKKIEGLPNEH